MTKKVNRYFMIVAVVFIIVSIAIPIGDYYISKTLIFSKGEFTTANEYEQSINKAGSAMDTDYTIFKGFYWYFTENYQIINEESIAYKAINTVLTNELKQVFSWKELQYGENLFIWYIIDKIIWLFIAYCIFVIPISMVDLFYKMIKKEVD